MLKFVSATFCLAMAAIPLEAACVTGDALLVAHPGAQPELTALVICRTKYASQNYQQQVPVEDIVSRSLLACSDEREQFYQKIEMPNGDPVFDSELDQLIRVRVGQMRSQDLTFDPIVVWGKCAAGHIVVPASRAGIDKAVTEAFAACQSEEDAMATFVSDRVAAKDVPSAVAELKAGARNALRQNLEARID